MLSSDSSAWFCLGVCCSRPSSGRNGRGAVWHGDRWIHKVCRHRRCRRQSQSCRAGAGLSRLPHATPGGDRCTSDSLQPPLQTAAHRIDAQGSGAEAARPASGWTEDRLWDACAIATPGKVKGRSLAGRFADLVAFDRFALEQQPVLEPIAASVTTRFNEWLMDKAKAGLTFTGDQLAWLNLIRDQIATSLSIEPDDFDYAPFSQRGGLGKAHQLFGEQLIPLLDELNTTLAS